MSATPSTRGMPSHPCYSFSHSATTARAHLPVAPRCNVQCRFCDRAFDCANESRPGVTAAILSPEEALARVEHLRSRLESLAVVGIAGPGDPLANPKETFETFRLVKARYPELILCLATNGLALADHVDEMLDVGLSHLTVTVNAIDPEVGRQVYAWVRFEGRARSGTEAAALLWERQKMGIAFAARRGLEIKINTILIPGVNEGEVARIARECHALGARHMNLIPLIPVKGTALESAGEPLPALLSGLRKAAEPFLPQLGHCKRCRADAAGLLGEDIPAAELVAETGSRPCGQSPRGLAKSRALRVAVASREGFFINQHLGEADRLFVFASGSDGSLRTEGVRALPPEGGGLGRWNEVAGLIGDCQMLFVQGIGAPPKAVLEKAGIEVQVLEGLISEAVQAATSGKDLGHLARREADCGSSCSGSASRGCGCA
jgi:nitrogen fixation protein NifB